MKECFMYTYSVEILLPVSAKAPVFSGYYIQLSDITILLIRITTKNVSLALESTMVYAEEEEKPRECLIILRIYGRDENHYSNSRYYVNRAPEGRSESSCYLCNQKLLFQYFTHPYVKPEGFFGFCRSSGPLDAAQIPPRSEEILPGTGSGQKTGRADPYT